MSGIIKNIILFAGLAIIAGLGYYLYQLNATEQTILGGDTSIDDARVASEEFLREVNIMQGIELSDALFTDPRFRSLTDFSKPVPSQPVGRQNPFAPTN